MFDAKGFKYRVVDSRLFSAVVPYNLRNLKSVLFFR